MPQLSEDDRKQVIHLSINLVLVELGIGSLTHAFHIPFGGHLMSINQGLFMTYLCKKTKKSALASWNMSTMTSILKSLSPVGNKFGPMLSICMQGNLFSLPIFALGVNLFSLMLGMILLSLWAFIQPFITLYFFFGHNLLDSIAFYSQKIERNFMIDQSKQLTFLACLISIKCFFAIILAWIIHLKSEPVSWFEYRRKQNRWPKAEPKLITTFQVAKLSLGDLLSPFFLFPLVLTTIFMFVREPSVVGTILQCLRPIAVGFMFFFLARHPAITFLVKALERRKIGSSFFKNIKEVHTQLRERNL